MIPLTETWIVCRSFTEDDYLFIAPYRVATKCVGRDLAYSFRAVCWYDVAYNFHDMPDAMVQWGEVDDSAY